MLATRSYLVRLTIQRSRTRDRHGPSTCSRMRGSDCHINEATFVVVGRTSDHIGDGVSQRRRKEEDDTLNIHLHGAVFAAPLTRCAGVLHAVCVQPVRQLHNWEWVSNPRIAASHRSPVRCIANADDQDVSRASRILNAIWYWSLFHQSAHIVGTAAHSLLLVHLLRANCASADPALPLRAGPLPTPRCGDE